MRAFPTMSKKKDTVQIKEVKVYYPYPMFIYPGQSFPILPPPSTVPPKLPLPSLELMQTSGSNLNDIIRHLLFPSLSAGPSHVAAGNDNLDTKLAGSTSTTSQISGRKRKDPPISMPAQDPGSPNQKRRAKATPAAATASTTVAGRASSAAKKKAPPANSAYTLPTPPSPVAAASSTSSLSDEMRTNYDGAKPAPKAKRVLQEKVPWETRFQQLLHFQKGYGHCRVPSRNPQHKELGIWVMRLRKCYKEMQRQQTLGVNAKNSLLDQDKIARLEAIGFQWIVRDTSAVLSWEERFEQLKEFRKEKGHCRVPRHYKKSPRLGEWVHTQRTDYREKTRRMLEEHLPKLHAIGFEFTTCKVNVQWEDRFKQLAEFRRSNGHCNVPKVEQKNRKLFVKRKSENENAIIPGMTRGSTQEFAFLRWVDTQRRNYWLQWTKGKSGTLNKARIKKMTDMGFDWGPEKKSSSNGRGSILTGFQGNSSREEDSSDDDKELANEAQDYRFEHNWQGRLT